VWVGVSSHTRLKVSSSFTTYSESYSPACPSP
jgi:hypothetical protein